MTKECVPQIWGAAFFNVFMRKTKVAALRHFGFYQKN